MARMIRRPPGYVSKAEAAERLGISEKTLERRMKAEDLGARVLRVGRRVFLLAADVEAHFRLGQERGDIWLAHRRRVSGGEPQHNSSKSEDTQRARRGLSPRRSVSIARKCLKMRDFPVSSGVRVRHQKTSNKSGAGGNRTPVPRQSAGCFYACS